MEHRIDQEYRQNVMVRKVFKIEKEHEVTSFNVEYRKQSGQMAAVVKQCTRTGFMSERGQADNTLLHSSFISLKYMANIHVLHIGGIPL
jgi:hypothetical protein